MAQTLDHRRRRDGAEGAPLDRPDRRGGSDHRRLPPPHAAAVGRLPLRPPADHSPLSRSSLHRCLERHGISRLPEVEGDKPNKKRFADYAIGYFYLDIAELHTAEGKLHLFVAIDRTSKLAFVRLEEKANTDTASSFLKALIEAVPYHIHTVLTDMACSSATRRATGQALPLVGACIASTGSAASTASSIA